VRKISISENYGRKLTPIRSNISRLSRGTVPAIRRISRIRVHFVLGQSHVTALASFRQTLTQGTDSGALFLRMTKSKEELAIT
jgi:hypothetical protein